MFAIRHMKYLGAFLGWTPLVRKTTLQAAHVEKYQVKIGEIAFRKYAC